MQINNYSFFQNKNCQFFPCHNLKNLNCLFCFCPLYHYRNCGGTYSILKNGLKDCSKCTIPHSKNGYEYIIDFLKNSDIPYGSLNNKMEDNK